MKSRFAAITEELERRKSELERKAQAALDAAAQPLVPLQTPHIVERSLPARIQPPSAGGRTTVEDSFSSPGPILTAATAAAASATTSASAVVTATAVSAAVAAVSAQPSPTAAGLSPQRLVTATDAELEDVLVAQLGALSLKGTRYARFVYAVYLLPTPLIQLYGPFAVFTFLDTREEVRRKLVTSVPESKPSRDDVVRRGRNVRVTQPLTAVESVRLQLQRQAVQEQRIAEQWDRLHASAGLDEAGNDEDDEEDLDGEAGQERAVREEEEDQPMPEDGRPVDGTLLR